MEYPCNLRAPCTGELGKTVNQCVPTAFLAEGSNSFELSVLKQEMPNPRHGDG